MRHRSMRWERSGSRRTGAGVAPPIQWRAVVVPAGGGAVGDPHPPGRTDRRRSAAAPVGTRVRFSATAGDDTVLEHAGAAHAQVRLALVAEHRDARGPSTRSSMRSPSGPRRACTPGTAGVTPRTTAWKLLAGGPLVLCAPAGAASSRRRSPADTPRAARARRARRVMRSAPRAPARGAAPAPGRRGTGWCRPARRRSPRPRGTEQPTSWVSTNASRRSGSSPATRSVERVLVTRVGDDRDRRRRCSARSRSRR